ncbi:ATP-dependent DNA helicase 2 subunit KU80, partial [Glycine soja]
KKNALLLLLDVGPSMHSVLPEIEKVCSMLVQEKRVQKLLGFTDSSNVFSEVTDDEARSFLVKSEPKSLSIPSLYVLKYLRASFLCLSND